MKNKKRPALLAEFHFMQGVPQKMTRDEYTEIFCIGYRCGIADALVELRAKFSPSSAAPQAEHSPPPPTPNNDTDTLHAGQPSILTQEIAQ